MKKILFTLCIATSFVYTANSQQCTAEIAPHVPSGSGGYFHIFSDTTINDPNGSGYYICGGVTLTMTYSAGSAYYLENGANLTIMDHEGDAVYAKGNCTILDNSTESIVVNKEASSTFSKPNNTIAGIVFTCSSMVFGYSAVGGSSPCSINSAETIEQNQEFDVHPNPVMGSGKLYFGQDAQKVALFNLSGMLIMKFDAIENNFIQLEGIQKGIYILQIQTFSGANYSSRLVVE